MIENLDKRFITCQKTNTLYKTKIDSSDLLNSIHMLIQNGFSTLVQLSCTDWIEDGVFSINYNLTTPKRDLNLLVELDIKRDDESLPSLLDIFPQSEVMERDIHEMYGINFIGNNSLGDFALENWKDIPPLRREFDTLAYVNEHFDFKVGREDNKDTKVEMKKRKEAKKKLKALEAEKIEKEVEDEK